MALADLTPAERQVALDAIELCAGPEGAAVDLDRSLELRRLLRRKLNDAGWERAWRIAAEIVVKARDTRQAQAAAGPRRASVYDEALVVEWARALGSVRVWSSSTGGRSTPRP